MQDWKAAPWRCFAQFVLAAACLSSLAACQFRPAQKLLKAKPAAISKFLDQRTSMAPMRHRLPYHFVWTNPDPKLAAVVSRRMEIYIPSVELRYLRPVTKPLARWEIKHGWIRPREEEIAQELRASFIEAFERSPQPRFRVVERPTKNCVVLQLALTELSPTSVKGNTVKLAAKFVVGPLSGVLGVFTKGNIAFEGKISVPGVGNGASFLQFSDKEKDKMTLYSARDFQPYAHAKVAIKEWARQFEEFTRTTGIHKVKESSFITLKPW